CIETKKFAPQLFASFVLSFNDFVISSVRDNFTVWPLYYSFKMSLVFKAISNVTSFSCNPFADAPGSDPPCPGSIKIRTTAAASTERIGVTPPIQKILKIRKTHTEHYVLHLTC